MKKAITLTLLCFCTIGGEETEKVATIEETLPVQEIEEEITFEEGLLSFAQCMREQGLDFPDPSFDSEGNPEFTDFDLSLIHI